MCLLTFASGEHVPAASEGGARAPPSATTTMVRVAHIPAESVAQLAWSADGAWLYAAVGGSVCCVDMGEGVFGA